LAIGQPETGGDRGRAMQATAEHREPCDPRGSCTVLGAPQAKFLRATRHSRRFRGAFDRSGLPPLPGHPRYQVNGRYLARNGNREPTIVRHDVEFAERAVDAGPAPPDHQAEPTASEVTATRPHPRRAYAVRAAEMSRTAGCARDRPGPEPAITVLDLIRNDPNSRYGWTPRGPQRRIRNAERDLCGNALCEQTSWRTSVGFAWRCRTAARRLRWRPAARRARAACLSSVCASASIC